MTIYKGISEEHAMINEKELDLSACSECAGLYIDRV